MSQPVLFVDNSFLSNIFSASAAPEAGLNILDALKSRYDVQITDVVAKEATVGASEHPKDQAIRQWLTDNDITPITTGVEKGKDAGELSLVEAYNLSQFDGAEKVIASDDAKFFNPDGAGADYVDSVMDTPNVLGQLLVGGHIQGADYIAVANAQPTMNGWMSQTQVEAVNEVNDLANSFATSNPDSGATAEKIQNAAYFAKAVHDPERFPPLTEDMKDRVEDRQAYEQIGQNLRQSSGQRSEQSPEEQQAQMEERMKAYLDHQKHMSA